jgi:hypothetical protein
MEKLDLDIHNYDLNDIIKLFGISKRLTDEDLKVAKIKMLKTHPDKSGLDPIFFTFYNKAFKILYQVWEFNQKGNTKKSDYSHDDYDTHKQEILNKWIKDNNFEDKKSFNEWFNKEFDNAHIYNDKERKGYEDWLRNAPIENEQVNDLRGMNMYIDKKKKELRELSLIEKREVEEIWNTNNISASDLSPDAPQCYDSDLFSQLSYQDLQKAHTESIIPITIEDYENKKKFNNVNDFISFRNNQDIQPFKEGEKYLDNKKKREEELSVRLAFNLAKQSEIAKQKNNDFWKNIQMLN